MKLAARAREQRMHDAAAELQRKLRSLRSTVAMIEANQHPADDGAPADAAAPANAVVDAPRPSAEIARAPTDAARAPAEAAPRPAANPAARPKPPVKFVRRNLSKFSREAFMADFEAMQQRDRSDC